MDLVRRPIESLTKQMRLDVLFCYDWDYRNPVGGHTHGPKNGRLKTFHYDQADDQ